MTSVLKLWRHIRNPTSVDVYLLEEHLCQTSPRSDLKRDSLRLFWRGRSKKKNNNNHNHNIHVSRDTISVPGRVKFEYYRWKCLAIGGVPVWHTVTGTWFELSVRWIPLSITLMFFLQTNVLCPVTRLYNFFHHAMLHTARLCHGKLSDCLSVCLSGCNVEVCLWLPMIT